MSEVKKVRKFNIIDVIIILAVVAAIVIVCYKFAGKQIVQSTSTQEYYVTYTTYEIAKTTADAVKEGDHINDNAGNIDLGTVTNINIDENSHGYANDAEGKFVMSAKDEFCFLQVTGKVNAVKTANGITVNGTKYLVGQSMTIEAGDAKIYVIITGIEPVEAE